MGLGRGWVALSCGEFHKLFFQMSFRGVSNAFWGAFWRGFGRQNDAKNRISMPLFTYLFFCSFLWFFKLIFGGSKPWKSRSRLNGSIIFAKLAFSRNSSNKFVLEEHFGSSHGLKHHQIRFGKPMFFSNSIFDWFSSHFRGQMASRTPPKKLKRFDNRNKSRSGTG